jgi:hypothetical protein
VAVTPIRIFAVHAALDPMCLVIVFFGFGTAAGAAPCSGSNRSQCAGTFNAISGVVDWKFAPKWDVYVGLMCSEFNGGLANAFIENNNIATTAGLRFRY